MDRTSKHIDVEEPWKVAKLSGYPRIVMSVSTNRDIELMPLCQRAIGVIGRTVKE